MLRTHHRLLISVLAVLPLAGCTATSAVAPRTRPALRLVAFDSCAELGRDLRAAAVRTVGPYGLAGEDSRVMPDVRTFAVPGAKAASATAAEAPAFSGTNVQEQGVDEPDLVKTDGRRIVTVSGSTLYVVDPGSRAVTGKLDLGLGQAGGGDLLLSGDRALVIASAVGRQIFDRRIRPQGVRSEIVLVDLGGPPRVVSRYRGDGTVVDARQTGSTARVVLSSTPAITFPFRATTDEGLLSENRKVLAGVPAEAWLPGWEIETGGTTTTGRLDCGAVSRPDTFSGSALVRLLSFDLGAPDLGAGSPVGVVSDGDIVYGTADSLYVANNQRQLLNGMANAATAPDAEIFRFRLPAAGKPEFVSSGKVPGMLLNQYAMSEWNGHLRVATTDRRTQVSAVRVLQEKGDKLVQVGEVDGLGRGEQIYSVRFLDARAYVVTFRKTDPLYSLDLADPARPRVTGELKITGYSAHLQPVGADRLIGIGQDATVDGMRTGTQISLFDVADPANPRRLAKQVVAGASSEAEFDPHALLWWEPAGLLVVPLTDQTSTGSLALRVTGSELREAGRLTPPGPDGMPARRTLVIGSVLWTVTDSGLLATDLSSLDTLGWVALS